MKKSDVIRWWIMNGNVPKVTHRFPINELPDTIKVPGIDVSGVIYHDVPLAQYKETLEELKHDECLGIGRGIDGSHYVDVKITNFSDTRWSRVQAAIVVEDGWVYIIDASRQGSLKIYKGDELLAPTENYPWEDWISTIRSNAPKAEQNVFVDAIKRLFSKS